ncbi:MAG TPA: hypothetical protein VF089_03880, partial [Candidatus Binatia bacterium]
DKRRLSLSTQFHSSMRFSWSCPETPKPIESAKQQPANPENLIVITEADTCRKYVLPKLYAAGWNDD